MIPKKIHYIWLGRNKKPRSFDISFSPIQKYAFDYEVKIWDEDNIVNESFYKDLPKYYFTLLENKKWAFASDILRCHILYKYGGVYFDTDQVLTNKIDDLLENKMFISTYHQVSDYYGFGLIGAVPDHIFLKKMIDFYNNYDKKEFIIINKIGSEIINEILEEERGNNNKNILNNKLDKKIENIDVPRIKILTQDYFYPLKNYCEVTENTRSYHMANTSWIPLYKKILFKIPFYLELKNIIKKLLPKYIRDKIFKIYYL